MSRRTLILAGARAVATTAIIGLVAACTMFEPLEPSPVIHLSTNVPHVMTTEQVEAATLAEIAREAPAHAGPSVKPQVVSILLLEPGQSYPYDPNTSWNWPDEVMWVVTWRGSVTVCGLRGQCRDHDAGTFGIQDATGDILAYGYEP
jgi:hypothetical protein